MSIKKYKSEVIADLRELSQFRYFVDHAQEDIDFINASLDYAKSTRTDAMPISGGTNGRDERTTNLIFRKDCIELRRQLVTMRIERVEGALNELLPNEKRVVQCCYIDNISCAIERLSDELGYEQAQIYRIQDAALVKLARMLYGCAEV